MYDNLSNEDLAKRAIKNFLLIMLAKWAVIAAVNIAAEKILNEK